MFLRSGYAGSFLAVYAGVQGTPQGQVDRSIE